jgi:glutamyl-Q tRNA(Asp) synthetase
VDDAAQHVTDVVRGADLLDSTARQIHLQKLLGLPTPRYLHVPVALDANGDKLSKQTGAAPLGKANARAMLEQALRFLGQPPTSDLAEALARWEPGRIPVVRGRRADCAAES